MDGNAKATSLDMKLSDGNDSDTIVSVESGECEMDIDVKEDIPKEITSFNNRDSIDKLQEAASKIPCKVKERITQNEINELYESLGISVDNPKQSGKTKGLRLEALHVRGVSEMSTDDILEYFKEYGPETVEWINDFSCNVVWTNAVEAARALLGLSRPVVVYKKGQTIPPKIGEDMKKDDDTNIDELKSQDKEEVIMIMDDSDDEDESDEERKTENEEEKEKQSETMSDKEIKTSTVDATSSVSKMTVDDVDVPVPPGRWRLGAPCSKAKTLLIRFASRIDKKAPGAEKRSQYYLKHGNPNYGGLKGLISRSCKMRFRQSNNVKRAPQPVSGKRSGPSSSDSGSDSEDEKQEVEHKKRGKAKRIRMRMYADDEEKRQKQRRTGASNPFLTTNLQNRLGKVSPLKVSISSTPYSGDEHDYSSDSEADQHQYASVVSEVSKGVSKNASVWTRLQLRDNYASGVRRHTSEEEEGNVDDDDDDDGDDDDDDDEWDARGSDLRSKIGNVPQLREMQLGVSGDLRNKLDKIRRDREVQKHRSPLLIQVTNNAGE